MIRRLLAALLVVLVAALSLLGSAGCAAIARRHQVAGVPIERRPTPPLPDTAAVAGVPVAPAPDAGTPAPPATEVKPAPPAQVPPVETAMSPEERHAALERIAADTTAVGGAVRKCAGKSLLPDQESVFDTTRSLLAQIRSALARDELWRAESLARKARQLALSLECR